MTDILHLPGWKATKTRPDGDELVIEADYIEPAVACTKCGVIGRLYRHGTKVLSFRDTPMHGKTVLLKGTAQRYRCRDCGETFVQPLTGVESDRRMTTRCVQFIRTQCLRDTFTRIAELVGCTEGTVRNIAADQIQRLDGEFTPYLPEWLGIDETQLDRGMRCVLTDVGRRAPIDILIDRDKHTVARWLYQFSDRSTVKGVAMDMWRPYWDTVKAVLGEHVPVVIDKFHVVRMANQSVDKVRIRVQKEKDAKTRVAWKRSKVQLVKRPENLSESQRFNLDMWLANEPEVAEAYRLKEAFFAIYDMSKDEAIAAYDAFLKSVPASMKTEFGDLTRAMKNWRTEILAYFDYPITNGYTEALNGMAKVINRAGRGYSFEVMRARILYRPGRPKYRPVEQQDEHLVMRPSPRRKMIAERGNRCDGCGGIYDDEELRVCRTGVILDEIDGSGMSLYCSTCYVRFHTEGGFSGSHDSTHLCE